MANLSDRSSTCLTDLDSDLLLHICYFLPPESLGTLSCVSVRCHEVASASHLWQQFCTERWFKPHELLLATHGANTSPASVHRAMQVQSAGTSAAASAPSSSQAHALDSSSTRGASVSVPGKVPVRSAQVSAWQRLYSTGNGWAGNDTLAWTFIPSPVQSTPGTPGQTQAEHDNRHAARISAFCSSGWHATGVSPSTDTSAASSAAPPVSRSESNEAVLYIASENANGESCIEAWTLEQLRVSRSTHDSQQQHAARTAHGAKSRLLITPRRHAMVAAPRIGPQLAPAWITSLAVCTADATSAAHADAASIPDISSQLLLAGTASGHLLIYSLPEETSQLLYTATDSKNRNGNAENDQFHHLPVHKATLGPGDSLGALTELHVLPGSSGRVAALADCISGGWHGLEMVGEGRNAIQVFDVHAGRAVASIQEVFESHTFLACAPVHGSPHELLAASVHRTACAACRAAGAPWLCFHRPNSAAAALAVLDLRAHCSQVSRFSLGHRSLYPCLRTARSHTVFTSHSGDSLAVWDLRQMSTPLLEQPRLNNHPWNGINGISGFGNVVPGGGGHGGRIVQSWAEAAGGGDALGQQAEVVSALLPAPWYHAARPAACPLGYPTRRAEHQGLWLDVCEDALVGRAENGCLWLWDLSTCLGWAQAAPGKGTWHQIASSLLHGRPHLPPRAQVDVYSPHAQADPHAAFFSRLGVSAEATATVHVPQAAGSSRPALAIGVDGSSHVCMSECIQVPENALCGPVCTGLQGECEEAQEAEQAEEEYGQADEQAGEAEAEAEAEKDVWCRGLRRECAPLCLGAVPCDADLPMTQLLLPAAEGAACGPACILCLTDVPMHAASTPGASSVHKCMPPARDMAQSTTTQHAATAGRVCTLMQDAASVPGMNGGCDSTLAHGSGGSMQEACAILCIYPSHI